MKKTIFLIATLLSTGAMATNMAVKKAAAKIKASDTRTVVTEVENTKGSPCLPEGKSFQVDLQVKRASFDREQMTTVYKWETVKTVGVDKVGRVTEVCAE